MTICRREKLRLFDNAHSLDRTDVWDYLHTVDLAKSYVVTVEYMEATRVATYSIWILAPVAVCWMWSRPSMSTEVLGRKLKKLWLTCAGTPGTGKIRIQAAMGMITKYTEKRKRDVAYM